MPTSLLDPSSATQATRRQRSALPSLHRHGPPRAGAHLDGRPQPAKQHKLHIIIDDERVFVHALALLLRSVGYQVVHVPDSVAAPIWLAAHTPGLVLLDLWLPAAGGRRLAHELHARYGQAFPRLVLTAGYLSSDAVQALGAAGYLRKPFDLDDLLRAVEYLVPITYDEQLPCGSSQ